jgi:hypothetical protein
MAKADSLRVTGLQEAWLCDHKNPGNWSVLL